MQTLIQPHLSKHQLPRAPGCCHNVMLQLALPGHCHNNHLHKNKHICSNLKRGTKRSSFLRQPGEFEHSSLQGWKSALKVVAKMFPVNEGFMIHLTHHLFSWTSSGQEDGQQFKIPQLRDQGLLLCTFNETKATWPSICCVFSYWHSCISPRHFLGKLVLWSLMDLGAVNFSSFVTGRDLKDHLVAPHLAWTGTFH